MPSKITFSDGSTIAYLYGADGTKLRTMHNIDGTVTTTDYCDNVIYENGTATRLLTEARYVSLSDNKYHYCLQDHQGNNRVVINQSGTVEETNHYYPFGSVFANTNNVQPYKYNGKELDSKKGLNWHDYGARHYDAALGRFMTVDPLAEKYYDTAPYAYVGNNPVNRIDPDGRDWKDALPHLTKSVSGNISMGLNAGFSLKVAGINMGAQINAGSVQTGSDGFKATSGVMINVAIVGVEAYDNAYELDPSHNVKEEGFKVNLPLWSEDHKTTTTFDSTKKDYKEVKEEKTVETETGNINISATLGIGAEVKINLNETWNFFIDLFK